jgi:hypothetical protein
MVEVQVKYDIISFQLTRGLNLDASIVIFNLDNKGLFCFFSRKNLLFMCVKFGEEQIFVFPNVLIGISDLNQWRYVHMVNSIYPTESNYPFI